MARIEDTIFCDGCGAEITWAPLIVHKLLFCCEDCSLGLACTCGEKMELGDEYREGKALTTTLMTDGKS